MNDTLLIEEPSEGVLLLTLNRPAQRNAIDIDLLEALDAALDDFGANDRWRAAVLTGAAPAFCATASLTFSPLRIHSMMESSSHAALVMVTKSARMMKRPASLSTVPCCFSFSPYTAMPLQT